MAHINSKVRIEQRQKAAQERKERWEKLSPQEQLADMDRRLGKGVGGAKQRARLKAATAPKPAPAKKRKRKRKKDYQK